MERISSRQNAVVKRFRDLARRARAAGAGGRGHAARGRPATDVLDVLLDGEHLVHEALACGVAVEIAAVAETGLAGGHGPLAAIARDVGRRGGRVLSVTDQVLAAMSPVQHPSGVVAIGRARPADLPAVFSNAAHVPLVVVAAGVQDPGNVGAIVRTAAAFGASGVIALDGSADPFGWKALRGAMGGTFRVPVTARAQLTGVIDAARGAGVHLVAAVPRGGTPLPALDLRRPVGIVLGAEGSGVDADTVRAVGQTVTIPMNAADRGAGPAQVESLNVAVAAAVILYEAMRQRRA
ncbi:MAG TPA: RNA methyltransferase [Vicinamibacterales bacterium]|nr:RNA methyltransferase [Vicinamibacterales bacterium]